VRIGFIVTRKVERAAEPEAFMNTALETLLSQGRKPEEFGCDITQIA
jgi:hypothetical protein